MADWKSEAPIRIGDRFILGAAGILEVPAEPKEWAGIVSEAFAGQGFGIFDVVSSGPDSVLLRQVKSD